MTTTRTYTYTSISITKVAAGEIPTVTGSPIDLNGNVFRFYVYPNGDYAYVLDAGITNKEVPLLEDYSLILDFSKMPQSEISKLSTLPDPQIPYSRTRVIAITNDGNALNMAFTGSNPQLSDLITTIKAKGYFNWLITGTVTANGGLNIISNKIISGIEDLTWKLRINKKNVKMFHDSTGKNYKTFTIGGHTFDFRTELTPAEDLGVLQDIIDALDWTKLVLTGIKVYPANSLVWGDLIGEPSLMTNVAVTSLTHAEIGASGTYPVTLNFTRTKSDGSTDTATKVVNVVATITLPKPALAVWYGDDTGNIYKDGVKTYKVGTTVYSVADIYITNSGDVIEMLWTRTSSTSHMQMVLNGTTWLHNDQTSPASSTDRILLVDGDRIIYYNNGDVYDDTLTKLKTSSSNTSGISISASFMDYFDNKVYYLDTTDKKNLYSLDLSTKTKTKVITFSDLDRKDVNAFKVLGVQAGIPFGYIVAANPSSRPQLFTFGVTGANDLDNPNTLFSLGLVFAEKVNDTTFKSYSTDASRFGTIYVATTDFAAHKQTVETQTYTTTTSVPSIANTVFLPRIGLLTDGKGYGASTDKKIIEFNPTAKTVEVKWTTEGSNPVVDWTGMRG